MNKLLDYWNNYKITIVACLITIPTTIYILKIWYNVTKKK